MMEKFGLELVTLCPANGVPRPFEMAKGPSVSVGLSPIMPLVLKS